VNEEVGYQLTPAWQSGLGQCSGIGSILSIFATAWFQQRYGYRRVIQTGLAAMFAFIFIVFFAHNIVSHTLDRKLMKDHARHRLSLVRLGMGHIPGILRVLRL
jgi:SP family general alpha glucoside:H+ symporter-like MFS transporter